jgi:hypothetical protein
VIIIEPQKQGELDGACGFYSVSNALNLLTGIDPDVTFRCLVESMLQDKNPMCFVDGMERGTLKDIISRTFRQLNEGGIKLIDEFTGEKYIPNLACKIPYWQSEPTNRSDFIKLMKSVDLDKNGVVAIMGYKFSQHKNVTSYAHWTVIKKVTNKSLITFDSGGERKVIPWSKVRISSPSDDKKFHSETPYFLFPKDIFLISNS